MPSRSTQLSKRSVQGFLLPRAGAGWVWAWWGQRWAAGHGCGEVSCLTVLASAGLCCGLCLLALILCGLRSVPQMVQDWCPCPGVRPFILTCDLR